MSDPPDRLKAALSDRYELIEKIGEGGMATVYLAEDLKHHRRVAVKVLKPELAAVVGSERFLAEIDTTANLQHPNILPLFDSGEADGFLFFVMPFVEGETLRDRIDRERQLPVGDALRIASDVAEALDYAHRQGVIHRDIKPANVLLQEGRPLIADFGIAIAVGAAGGSRLTETGLSVGTPYYMSPEQATGDQAVGPATDIYALGCVLYEMLVGEPPYYGATAQAVLGKIIAGGPVSATAHRSAIASNVDAAIRCALEKLPADRFTEADAFARALNDPSFRHGGSADGEVSRVAVGGPWKGAALAFGVGFAGLLLVTALGALRPEEPESVLRYMLEVPIEVGAAAVFGSAVTISPDGERIAYLGRDGDVAQPRIWIRERSQLEPRPVPGTERAYQLFFSSDGTRIGFITDDRALRVVSLGGEPPLTLLEGMRRGGGSWGDDGFIYYAESEDALGGAGLRRIPATGGQPEVVTAVDTERGEVRHYFPDVLPGSRAAVFTIALEENYDAERREVGVVDLETGEVSVLFKGMVGHWSPSGHVLVVDPAGALLAASFDERTLEAGPLVPLFEGVQVEVQASVDLDISMDGTLVYAPGGIEDRSLNQPVWVDRAGNVVPIDPEWTGDYYSPRLSPDGRRLALSRLDTRGLQVWVKQLDTGPEAKLSFVGNDNLRAAWTADGGHVAFVSGQDGVRGIHLRRADAAVPAEPLLVPEDGNVSQIEFSPDGRWMVFGKDGDLFIAPADDPSNVRPLLAEPFDEENPAISPDGRWIAFNSSESGLWDVYVRPFPNTNDGKWQVSIDTGASPRWAPDGSEIYYKTGGGDFMAAQVETGSTLTIGERRILFQWSPFLSNSSHRQYDVHPDGDRFVMIREADADLGGRLLVVENFFREIEERVGG